MAAKADDLPDGAEKKNGRKRPLRRHWFEGHGIGDGLYQLPSQCDDSGPRRA
jgi:hypothetical protein